MNTYLLPICDGGDNVWIDKVQAKSITEASEKFVKRLADDYDCVDYGGTLDEAYAALLPHNVIIGDIYDIDDFQ